MLFILGVIFYILFIYGIYKLIIIAIKAHEKNIEDFNNSNFSKNANVNYYEMKNNIGSQGEYKLYKYLNYNITDKFIINNIYLEKTPYQTTEIDMVLLCKKGIFVFEVKNYSGWIFGSRKQTYWIQRFQSGVKYKFYNPIMQNDEHIRALKEYLQINSSTIFKSIVIFTGIGELKTDIEYIKNNYVLNDIHLVKDIIELSEDTLTEERIKRIYDMLKVKTGKSKEYKQEHINRINS